MTNTHHLTGVNLCGTDFKGVNFIEVVQPLNKTNASLDVAPHLGYYFFAGWQDSEYNHLLRFTDNGSRILFLT